MSEREKTFIALIASAVLHIVGALFTVVWLRLHPDALAAAKPAPDLSQLEVTLMPAANATPPPALDIAAAATPEPTPKKVIRTTLDTAGLQETETPPENAMFESDQNSRAASELPATGDLPLPTQEGKNLPTVDFKSQDYSLGNGAQPATPAMEIAKNTAPAAPAQLPTPAPTPPEAKVIEKPTPKPEPSAQPSPTPEEAKAEPTPFFQPTPVPTPVPASTPEPTPVPTPAPTPVPDDFALGKPTPTPVPASTPEPTPEKVELPKPTPVPAATPTPTPAQQFAKLAMPTPPLAAPTPELRARPQPPRPPTPPAASEPGTQTFKEKTKIDGGIQNRGKAGVDAVATPFGKYRNAVKNSIGSRWNHYVRENASLVTSVGEVVVSFKIDQNGKVEDVKIISNSANDGLANITIRAILESKLPPIPDELTPMLKNGRLEISSVSFYCYDLNQ
jgi:TonB family protein